MNLHRKFVPGWFVTNSEQAFPRVLTGDSGILPAIEALPAERVNARNLQRCSFFVTYFPEIAKIAPLAFPRPFENPDNFCLCHDICQAVSVMNSTGAPSMMQIPRQNRARQPWRRGRQT